MSAQQIPAWAFVARGAELLDERSPSWYRDVDVTRLDMASKFDCVVGQLFGVYRYGLERLATPIDHVSLLLRFAREHGFDAGKDGDFEELTDAWIIEIYARRDRYRVAE